MKRGFSVGLVLLLSACSSTPPAVHYYQLPSTTSGRAIKSVPVKSAHIVWVERVSVADYLAGNGLVYQTSPVRYVIAASNQWSSPLEQQLQQTLVDNLGAALPGWLVTSQPLTEKYDTLNVNITGFHGRFDGQAVVSGEWLLQKDGRLIKRAFETTLPQQADGYDALVSSLAKGWQQEAQRIAEQIALN